MIAGSGPLTFDRFLAVALYHPQHGFYANRVPGRGVSYVTSASIGPWFGRMVACELVAMWEALGRPDPFTVTEFGAGLGGLAASAIQAAGPLEAALRWRIVERFPGVEDMQRRTLGADARRVEWLRALEPGPPVTGCVLANEVLDNFLFHRFERTADGIREVYVVSRDGRLAEQLGPVSEPALVDAVVGYEGRLGEGDRFEVFAGIDDWCRQVSASLDRGYLLVVDYGDEEPDVWLKGRQGTVATYSTGRRKALQPLEDPGRQDITADVDFTQLDRSARNTGLEFELLTLQRFWLATLGLAAEAQRLQEEVELASAFGWGDDARLLAHELQGMQKLLDPAGLGGCLVYRASKGIQSVA